MDPSVEAEKIVDGSPYYKWMGCYFNRDTATPPEYVWSDGKKEIPDLTLESCSKLCQELGEFEFMGMEMGMECWCSAESPDTLEMERRDGECIMPCSGDPGQTCGGLFVMSVHKIHPGNRYINIEQF